MSLLDPSTGYVRRPGEWRRKGENGPPLVSDPNGEANKNGTVKTRTYSRPSNFGKQVENTYNLERWAQRQGVVGMFLEPSLFDEMAKLWAEDDHETSEWKSAVDGIYTKAKKAAGGMVAADRGTHGHLLTEDHDLDRSVITRIEDGEELGLPAGLQVAVGKVWQRLLDEYFEVLAVEAACVYDRWRVAGTLDRIVRTKVDLSFDMGDGRSVVIPAGTVLVLDIKTGGLKTDRNGVPIFWHSYAVQVAGYAYGRPYDVDTEMRGDWPWEVSTTHAIIAHIDLAGGLDTDVVSARLIYVDVAAGWSAGELVCAAKEWQKSNGIFSPVDSYVVAETVAKETSCESSAAPVSTTSTRSPSAPRSSSTTSGTPTSEATGTSSNSSSDSATTSPTPSSTPSHSDRAERLRQRFFLLNDADRAEFRSLLLDPDDLDGIEAALDRIDQFASVKVAPVEPVAPKQGACPHCTGVGSVEIHEPGGTRRWKCGVCNGTGTPELPHGPDEGADVGDAEFEALSALYNGLTGEGRAWFVSLVDQARSAGVSFHGHKSTGKRTVRRFEIYRGLLTLAGWGDRSSTADQETRRAS